MIIDWGRGDFVFDLIIEIGTLMSWSGIITFFLFRFDETKHFVVQ